MMLPLPAGYVSNNVRDYIAYYIAC